MIHQEQEGCLLLCSTSCWLCSFDTNCVVVKTWNRAKLLNVDVTSHPKTHDLLETSLSPAGHPLPYLHMGQMDTNLTGSCENHRRCLMPRCNTKHFPRDLQQTDFITHCSCCREAWHVIDSKAMCTSLCYSKLIHSKNIYQVPTLSHLLKWVRFISCPPWAAESNPLCWVLLVSWLSASGADVP